MSKHQDAIKFLGQFCWTQSRVATLTAILPDGGTVTESFDGGQWRELRDFIDKHNGKRNIYYSVNATGRLTNKAKKADITHLCALHVDVDDLSDAAFNRIRSYKPAPTTIICSGNGFNALWLLDKPLGADCMEDIEARNRGLIAALGGDSACWNGDRILRLPHTWNLPSAVKRKKGFVKVQSYLVEANWDRRYDPEQFPAVALEVNVGSTVPVHLSDNVGEVDIDDLPLDHHWKITILRGKDLSDPDRYASRSEVMFACVCAMVSAGIEADIIAAVLLDPDYDISEHVLAQTHPHKCAARQIERATARINQGA